jgi:hypothetical protein
MFSSAARPASLPLHRGDSDDCDPSSATSPVEAMLVHRSDCGRRDTCPTDKSERKSLPCIAAIGMSMGCKQGPAQRRQCPCIAAIAMSVDPGPAALVRSILEIAAT